MMDLKQFMTSYADEINGNYSEYDEERSVIIVPLKGERFQAVVAEICQDEKRINVSSKVCDTNENLNIPELLEENHKHAYCKFAVSNGFLKVESNFNAVNLDEDLLKQVMLDAVPALAG